ncbi:histidine phosphatase family protein [Pseudonocardia yunnanensis]|uniref:Histidine phosphatase family protein n=1 Tax=Pseudonocardia yunnanensis TaxID=58107 RepID=A0ABW4EWZ4_9PSEU
MTLLLARHGQTVWHAENRYAGGHSDIDLTPAGVLQAERLGSWARKRGVDAVVASPLRRAVETARPSALACETELEIIDDLREVGFGVAEGRTLDELDPDVAARFRADPAAHPFPGAEHPAAAAQRAADTLRVLAARRSTVLVVAHNTLLRLGLCTLIGLPVARYRHVFPRLENGAVTEVAVPADRTAPAALLSLNVPVL